MQIPKATHLQFLVLSGLFPSGEQAGCDLRGLLKRHGVRQSGPAFYQMMARLEDIEWVEGWYEKKESAGQTVQERRYRLTHQGRLAWLEARDFYASAIAGVEGLERSARA